MPVLRRPVEPAVEAIQASRPCRGPERKEVARSFAQVEPLLERVPGVFAIGKGIAKCGRGGDGVGRWRGQRSLPCDTGARDHVSMAICKITAALFTERTWVLITCLLSTVFRRGNHMNWFYWNTAWSLFFSLVWFMTITHNPDARISDAHLRDEAFGG